MAFQSINKKETRVLLRELIITDFKLRYQNSALGYLWSVIKPLFLFTVLYLVFDRFLNLGRGIEHYPVYLLTGVVLWTFFSEATTQGLGSIVKRGGLIRKINFPKYIIVVSATVSALINLAINLLVVLVFCLVNQVDIGWSALLIIPLIIELYVFALAIAFFLSSINAKYRDIGYLWEILLQAAFYATPIIYPLQMVISQFEVAAKIIMLNPVAQVIQDARQVLVTNDAVTTWELFSNMWYELIPMFIVLLLVLLGIVYFRKNSKHFAEQI